MPQLDVISFLNQIFWLCLVFVFFYLFVFKNLVPFISRIFKIRHKKNVKAIAFATALRQDELQQAEFGTESMFAKTIASASVLFSSFSNKVNTWVNSEVTLLNTKPTAALNKNFLAALCFVHLQSFLVSNVIAKVKPLVRKPITKVKTSKVTKSKKVLSFTRRWQRG
jgi:hypothetical protein